MDLNYKLLKSNFLNLKVYKYNYNYNHNGQL